MKMKNYIEQGEKKAGSQKELSNILGISASYIRMVKAGQKGFSIGQIFAKDLLRANPQAEYRVSQLYGYAYPQFSQVINRRQYFWLFLYQVLKSICVA